MAPPARRRHCERSEAIHSLRLRLTNGLLRRCAPRNAGWTAPDGIRCAKMGCFYSQRGGPSVMQISTIGLDIAKNVFQVHGEDGEGKIVCQKKMSRRGVVEFFSKLPACMVALEACGTSHYWGRTLRALGHEVRLIPAGYVKPFVKRNKTDARDAAAICVAAQRDDMRPVAIKSE